MRTKHLTTAILGLVVSGVALFGGGGVAQSDTDPSGIDATRTIYGQNISKDSAEFIVSPARIQSAVLSGAPSAVWEALEHGEKVECLACIPTVATLLYDQHSQNREIAAWWLRRRVFGVFGAGEVYEKTLATLAGDPSPQRRAYAAYAVGEFLAAPGVKACADAIAKDPDPGVRAAAASALGRLNDDGAGGLSHALGDGDASVKLAALKSAGRINTFTDTAAVARLVGDGDAQVRRRALDVLATLRVRDSVGAVVQLAQNDADRDVRTAACNALGAFGDASVKGALTTIASSDKDGLVRDAAQVALLRL